MEFEKKIKKFLIIVKWKKNHKIKTAIQSWMYVHIVSQLAFTYPKLTTEILKQGVKHVQS